ncbi:MAG: hypothetical protein HEEMFOPI_00380 [Holosporales bacterium]
MTKPEWGTKRTCMACSARFYDLNNKPATCPKCNTVLETLSTNSKSKKTKAEKARDLLGVDDSVLGSGVDFSADTLLDESLIADDEVLDDGLDDLAMPEEEDH